MRHKKEDKEEDKKDLRYLDTDDEQLGRLMEERLRSIRELLCEIGDLLVAAGE